MNQLYTSFLKFKHVGVTLHPVSFRVNKCLLFVAVLISQLSLVTAQTTANMLADKMLFSSNSAGSVTYLPITTAGGATLWQSGVTLNTDAVTSINIPGLANGAGYSFSYDAGTFTTVYISNNGFITFGSTAPATSNYNPIAAATGYGGAVAGYAFNLVASAVSGAAPEILYQVTGIAPNREFVVEFKDLGRTGIVGDRFNFQIRLAETSNVIKVVYGTWAVSTTTTTLANFGQVGLRGESSADFHTRIVALSAATNHSAWSNSGGSGDVGSAPRQTSDISTAGINSMRCNSTCFPSTTSTLTYSWTPINPGFYQLLPYTQNFDTWINQQAINDVPATTGVITWPATGNLSWRNISEPALNSGWQGVNGNFVAPLTQAGTGAAVFNQYSAANGTKGVIDFFLNFSAPGAKVADFYIRNPGGSADLNDILQVFLSTDGGSTFSQIGSNFAAPTPSPAGTWSAKQSLALGSSTATSCILRFQGVSDYGSGAENLAIDELSVYLLTPCAVPTAQPTALVLSAVTATSLNGSFTAASPAPSNYIIFRSTVNVAPAPVNGTNYTSAGSPYTFSGNPYTVVNSTGTGPITFTETSLSANTTYYYWIMSVNNSCAGQPFYRTTTPLTGTALTCTAAPASLSGVAASTSSATINFATVTGATSYVLQYSVAGANSWVTAAPAPLSSPYTLTGLATATAYDIRLRAPNASCGTLITTLNVFTTNCLNSGLPYTQGFNSTTIPLCWSQQYVTGTSNIQYVASSTNPATAPQEGADFVFWNSFSIANGNQTRLVSPPLTTTGAAAVNTRFYWYHDNSAYTGVGYADEGVRLQYSLNGTTWFDVQAVNRLLTGSSGWTLYDIALPAGAVNVPTVYVGLLFTSRVGNNCSLDNFQVYIPPPCTAPAAQPAALNITSVTATTLSGSFTAAIPAPSGYIVLRSTSSTAPLLTNGTSYVVGNTYPIGAASYTVVANGSSTSFTQTGLAANTTYYYYVLSFRSTCAGAPFYLNTSPLSENVLTCTAASATLTGAATGPSSATVNFTAIAGAAAYELQYSVAGANAWLIASPPPVSSPYSLTGLAPGTAYDIRITGPNANCGTARTTSSAFSTPCALINSLPWTENFDGMATTGSAIVPPCWLHVAGTKPFISGTAALSGYHDPASAPNYITMAYSNTTASYLWTPGFQLTAGQSYDFSFKWTGDGYAGWTGDLLYNSIASATGATLLGNFIAAATTTTAAYTTRKFTFVPATTGSYYFATRVSSTGTPWALGFDDYSLRVTPACNYAGTAAIAASAICSGSGSTTLSAVDYSTTGAGLAYQWQYSSDNFASDINNLAGGTNPVSVSTGIVSAKTYYRLRVFCTALGFSYSNVVSFTVGNYAITGTTPASRCGVGTVTLNATATAGSTISWYNSSTGGVAIATGPSFVTPEISTTTNFYAGANDGGTAATIGATYSGSSDNADYVGAHGILITTTSPNIIIKSALVPFTGKGSFTIQLQTTAGVVVNSITTGEITGGGDVPVVVPLNIPVGTPGNYRLIVSAVTGTINNLGYLDGAAFPYSGLGGAFTVTAGFWYGSDGANLYLFNLEVTNVCESARSLIAATVTPPPALTISSAAAAVCGGASASINVTSPVGNFVTYSWSPVTGVAAGGTPAGTIATFTPSTTTNYTLTATSASNCVNKATTVITIKPAAPLTTGAVVCSGTNASITSSTSCNDYTDPRTNVAGSWNAATDPVAIQPVIFLPNSPTCEFDPDGNTMNYTTLQFQVTVTGTYNFLMDANTLDGMGYIVTGAFIPGVCPGTGTWIVGDDDSGPGLMPMMDAPLVAGVTYTLITTVYEPSSGTNSGAYNWSIVPPAGGLIVSGTTGTIQWWTLPSGGTLLGTGSPFNPVGVAGSGFPTNTTVGTNTYYATCSNNNTCRTPTVYTIGATGQWTGTTSTAWSNALNWCGGIPGASTDVSISTGVPNMPLLNAGTGTTRNLSVHAGTTLTINNATLKVGGTITANNTINAAAGTIELNGATTQAVSGSSFTGRSIKNMIASNSVNVSTVANDSLRITGALSFGNVNSKVFNSGDNVILVSDAAGTARVADITNNGANSGNSVTGKFVVQRYIPARRAWRLMTAPIAAGAQTINQAWQEGAGGNWALNPKPGFGTHITGGSTRTTLQGFDQGPNNCSIYGYSGSSWSVIPATTAEAVTSRQGFMLYVRGSRAINLPTSNPATVPEHTVLRPTGAIKTGSQAAVSGTGFTVVGNPYPSAINFNALTRTGVIGGVGGNAYYVWDPQLGGSFGQGAFVTFSWNGTDYDKNIGPSNIDSAGIISSGAAFMVNLAPGGSIGINENDKVADGTGTSYLFRPTGNMGKIRTTLYAVNPDASLALMDGNLVSFNEACSNLVDNEDAVKMNNFSENFALFNSGSKIAIERRSPLTAQDTLFYTMWNMRPKAYQITCEAQSLNLPAGLIPFMEDRFLGVKTALATDGTTDIHFAVTSDPASVAADRFRIVFEPATTLPVSFISISAALQGNAISVQWAIANQLNIERYIIEKSTDGIHFEQAGETTAIDGHVLYNWLDQYVQADKNFYRIKSIDNYGQCMYSSIVKVTTGKTKASISVYPNPVKGKLINLSFNNVPKGNYQVQLYSLSGQLLLSKQLNITSSNAVVSIKAAAILASGNYQLKVLHNQEVQQVLQVMVE